MVYYCFKSHCKRLSNGNHLHLWCGASGSEYLKRKEGKERVGMDSYQTTKDVPKNKIREKRRIISGIRSGSPKTILTALLKTVNHCGSKLHIQPLDLQYTNTKCVFKVCLNVKKHVIYFKWAIDCINIPGGKSCIVPLQVLSQPLYVSPEQETKETKIPLKALSLNVAFYGSCHGFCWLSNLCDISFDAAQ